MNIHLFSLKRSMSPEGVKNPHKTIHSRCWGFSINLKVHPKVEAVQYLNWFSKILVGLLHILKKAPFFAKNFCKAKINDV